MEDFAANVRPEFLHFVGQAIVQNQKTKSAGVAGSVAVLLRMVDVGDGRRSSVSDGFGLVKAHGAGIFAGDEQAIHGVKRAVPERPSPQLIVARIFVQQTGKDGGGHIRADRVVRE